MRVLVIGATGFLSAAVVRELIQAGHRVTGLALSEPITAALTAAGAEVLRGDLADVFSLYDGAARADGVIHLAVNHDFAHYAIAGQLDLRAVETLGAALAGTGKPLVTASCTPILTSIAPGRLGTEDLAPGLGTAHPRARSESATLATARRGVRASVVRLPPTVYGEGDNGILAHLIATARDRGVSAYVGDGANRWPAVHLRDAARLFRLALEAAPAGAVLHAAGDAGVPFHDIAETIGRQLAFPTISIRPDDAGEHFGWLSSLVPLDNPTSSVLTQRRLGWRPERRSLIADLDAGHYFTAARTATHSAEPCELCRVTMRRWPQLT